MNDLALSKEERLKLPPHSIEAERSVLGGLMLDNAAWDTVFEIIREKDFYHQQHRLIFRVMEDLANRDSPFDVITTAEALKKINELASAGGEIYLFELSKNTPSAANIKAYADIVREHSLLRQLIAIAQDVASSAFHPEGRGTTELIDQAEAKIFSIAEQHVRGAGPLNIKNWLTRATQRIDTLYHSNQSITGLPTGYTDLDELTSGLQTSDLIIIAARPSMGKTSFAVNIAEHAAIKTKAPTLIFSLEMPGEALALRMISSLGRIDQHHLRTGKLTDEDWPRISSAVTVLSEAKMFIDDTPSLTPAELRVRARRIAKDQGQLGLIVIDYLQLMTVPGYKKDNRVAEISEISRSLKSIAKELHVPVIALSQLNRSLEQRTDRRPVMSDLRESGAIEQDADLILFIYRDEVYNEESTDKGIAEIIIAKHRNGPIGKIKLTFNGQFTRFENYLDNRYSA
ncbi:MAG: replicative DNA helicase [Gammaproteobacteria bacterium RIFCSPLOWO2_02_FULL_38_11]|nr:MAG: replicative DNA helicase [Gammaproteobacteria bacterium RIFCSPLOWO2_02_FULL_38_11]